jgi:hypothetical protein
MPQVCELQARLTPLHVPPQFLEAARRVPPELVNMLAAIVLGGPCNG